MAKRIDRDFLESFEKMNVEPVKKKRRVVCKVEQKIIKRIPPSVINKIKKKRKLDHVQTEFSENPWKGMKETKKRFDPYVGICGEWVDDDSDEDMSKNDGVVPYII